MTLPRPRALDAVVLVLCGAAMVACGSSTEVPDGGHLPSDGGTIQPLPDGGDHGGTCAEPGEHFTWPVPEVPLAITPSATWKMQLGPQDAFVVATDPAQAAWVKFSVLLSDPQKVYFQDGRVYPFHYDFATERLDPFREMTRRDFDARSLHVANQEVVLGAVLFGPGDVPEYGIQLVGLDAYNPHFTQRILESVRASVQAEGFRAFYMPTVEQLGCATEAASFHQARGFEVSSAARWSRGEACYAPGWALGRLMHLPPLEIDAAYLSGALKHTDILLTDGVPAEIPYLQGVITLTPATPNSHVAILAKTYGTPFVHVSGTWVQAMVGREVLLLAKPEQYGPGCDVRVIDVQDRLPAVLRAELEALKVPPILVHPPKQSAGVYVRTVDGLRPADARHYGGKASNYGVLRAAIPQNAQAAVALSFDVWEGFMTQPHGSGRTLGEEIEARLSPFSWPPPDLAVLDDALREVRGLIRGAGFPAALRAPIEAGLSSFEPTLKLRFRSSTNVEDGDGFTGAGLYDSYSGCLADDLDADTVGPSHCNPAQPEERGIYRAIQRVYASFYNRNAYLERLRRGVDEGKVGMAVLVHHSAPDATELANGVAIYVQQNGFGSLELVTQAGAESVTNPTGVTSPEIVTGLEYAGSFYFDLVQRSSLVPANQTVLGWGEEYQQLGGLLRAVRSQWFISTGSDADLDFEWKKVQPGTLSVKQVRPLPRPSTEQIPPFLIDEPVRRCIYQGEYADVFAMHRLKARFELSTDMVRLTSQTLSTSVWGHLTLNHAAGGTVQILDGHPGTWPQATYSRSGQEFFQRFVPASGTTWTLAAAAPATLPRMMPIITARDFNLSGEGLVLRAQYSSPVPGPGGTTRTEEQVRLFTCPEDNEVTSRNPREALTFTGPDGVKVETAYWFPEPRSGISAGYTAWLHRWDETRISGLTSRPIVLKGYFSQSFRPEHHNNGASYIFEPRLEPEVEADLLAELEALNIAALFIEVDYQTTRFFAIGLNGAIRSL
jgi:hypothetical protein